MLIITMFFLIAVLIFLLPSPTYGETQVASWYGARPHGRATASGEPFDERKFTAGHPTLPFGTFLLVCFEHCSIVKVNDRSPDSSGYLYITRAAANSIGWTAPVPELLWTEVIHEE